MNHEDMTELAESLNRKLKLVGLEHTYARVKPLSSGEYEVRVVVHPDEESYLPDLPSSVVTSPWVETSNSNSPYLKITPRTPLPKTDDFGFYPSWSRRNTDGPALSPDVNPAASGLRRIPELQDLVRVSSMNNDLKSRISHVINSLTAASRLQKVALAGSGYAKESEHLISELLEQFVSDGYTGRHKIVRLVKALKKAMQSDGYSFMGD